MKKEGRGILIAVFVLALCLSVVQNIVLASHSYSNLAAVQYTEGGALLARYGENGLIVERVEPDSTVSQRFTVPEKIGGKRVSLQDMAADTLGNVYLLLELSDPLSGSPVSQQLQVYRPGRLLFPKI